MLMPIVRPQPISCPACGVEIVLPLQAKLRAQDLGTAISCPKCGGTWLLKLQPAPAFLPLSTPKRKRGPKRYHPDAEE
jgi:DNA-directed RNA polymerase subunit RPC12/RpoP